jgi:MYND finger
MTSHALSVVHITTTTEENERGTALVKPVFVSAYEKKRFRESPIPPGMQTPILIVPNSPKRSKVDYATIPSPPLWNESDLLRILPEEVLGYVISFLCSLPDRAVLQLTCRQFQRLSNSDAFFASMNLGGNIETGQGGIIRDDDTIESAIAKVSLFARVGNLEALYTLGMIKSYCQPDVEGGILILQHCANDGYIRAHYTLGLILRDSHPNEASRHMQQAAAANYLPALQEVLPIREMKLKFGELTAAQLRPYLDPVCLNRLLCRHYVDSSTLRELNTSHCWNPICGRWAFKAQTTQPSSSEEAVTDTNVRVSRMKMCSRCCRAKYCSKLCQVYDWRSGRHKTECQYL